MPELLDPARAPTLSRLSSTGSVKPAPLTRAERVRRFGVDIPADRLEWKAGWEPGGERLTLSRGRLSRVGVVKSVIIRRFHCESRREGRLRSKIQS